MLPHEIFLKAVFGSSVFGDEKLASGFTQGQNNRLLAEHSTYSALATSEKYAHMGFHPHPYSVWERAQLGLWGTPGVVPMPLRPFAAKEYESAEVRRQVGKDYDSEVSWLSTTINSKPFDPKPLAQRYHAAHRLERQPESRMLVGVGGAHESAEPEGDSRQSFTGVGGFTEE